MIARPKKVRRAFTLVELLTVVLIISILMSVGLPLYVNAVSDAKRKTCRDTMQTIANTVMAARVKNGAADFSGWNGASVSTLVASTPDKVPDLTVTPVCPAGGIYTIAMGNTGDNTSFKIACSAAPTNAPAHSTFQPGVDSN